jgi:YesN/AraC family two-component response regulator
MWENTSHLLSKGYNFAARAIEYLLEMQFFYVHSITKGCQAKITQKLSITHHQLSQLLNDGIKRKFFDYINVYRIEEAKTITTPGQYKNHSGLDGIDEKK